MANNTILASDNFASGSLASGWSALTILGYNEPNVESGPPHFTQPTALNTEASIYWSAVSWPADQASEIVVKTLTAEVGTYVVMGVRINPANGAGYFMNLVNGTATISYFNGSSSTTLGTPVTGIVVAANDVLTFAVAGSVLTFLQNGKRLFTVGDAMLTSGFPGFGMTSSVNVAHTQVFAWRGFNAVQQDGVWTKQGVVLAPNATDIAGWGVYEGSCMYDTNPILLTQYTNVYKLWFSGGSMVADAFNIYYAESPDLVTWTRQVAPVISAFAVPQVIKVGSTYYLYCQASNAQGSGPIAYYTSSDGVTFAQQSASVLVAGTSGQWDASNIYTLKPIAVINGTWYALYGSLAAGNAKVGLVTSTDGAGAVWTKYASNPVLPNAATKGYVYPYQCFYQAGNTFYIWMQKCPTASMGATSAFDPNDIVRYSTTDFKTYSAPVMSIHHSQIQEAVNTPTQSSEAVGGTAPTAIFNINGVAHMLYEGSQGDTTNPVLAQWQVAIAPASIANLVQFSEDAVQQTATDAFTSGTGNLDSNWSAISGFLAMKIVAGNLAEPSNQSATGCGAAYTAGGTSGNQYAEITLASLVNSSGYLSPLVLINTTTGACYIVNLLTGPAGTVGYKAAIAFFNGSALTNLTGSVGITPTLTDVIRLSAVQVSGGVVLSLFQNGFLIAQGEDYSSTYLTSGYPGFAGTENGAGNSQISLFGTGNTNVIPNYITGGNSGGGLLRLLGVN